MGSIRSPQQHTEVGSLRSPQQPRRFGTRPEAQGGPGASAVPGGGVSGLRQVRRRVTPPSRAVVCPTAPEAVVMGRFEGRGHGSIGAGRGGPRRGPPGPGGSHARGGARTESAVVGSDHVVTRRRPPCGEPQDSGAWPEEVRRNRRDSDARTGPGPAGRPVGRAYQGGQSQAESAGNGGAKAKAKAAAAALARSPYRDGAAPLAGPLPRAAGTHCPSFPTACGDKPFFFFRDFAPFFRTHTTFFSTRENSLFFQNSHHFFQ
jgi:hypothetical protein